MLAELVRILLYRNVCQMDEPVVRIFRVNIELVTTGPQVALLAEVDLTLWVHEDPNPYVELTLFH